MTTCSILTPSYPCDEKEIENTEKNIKSLGFNNSESFITENKIFNRWAGSAESRLEKFYSAWNSKSEAVLCCKGGSGIIHFLPLIEKSKLKNKKMFVGYSDITQLLLFLHTKLGIITIHGPNGSKKLDDVSLSALRDSLEMKNYGIKFEKKQCVNEISFSGGQVIGGNLGRIVELLPYVNIDFKDKIVFFEEVGYTEFRIFNLLASLKNSPSFEPKVIVFGGLGIKDKKLMREMILYLFPDIPMVFDVSFGHTTPNIAIPIGADCEISFKERKIKFAFPKKHKKYAIKFD